MNDGRHQQLVRSDFGAGAQVVERRPLGGHPAEAVERGQLVRVGGGAVRPARDAVRGRILQSETITIFGSCFVPFFILLSIFQVFPTETSF